MTLPLSSSEQVYTLTLRPLDSIDPSPVVSSVHSKCAPLIQQSNTSQTLNPPLTKLIKKSEINVFKLFFDEVTKSDCSNAPVQPRNARSDLKKAPLTTNYEAQEKLALLNAQKLIEEEEKLKKNAPKKRIKKAKLKKTPAPKTQTPEFLPKKPEVLLSKASNVSYEKKAVELNKQISKFKEDQRVIRWESLEFDPRKIPSYSELTPEQLDIEIAAHSLHGIDIIAQDEKTREIYTIPTPLGGCEMLGFLFDQSGRLIRKGAPVVGIADENKIHHKYMTDISKLPKKKRKRLSNFWTEYQKLNLPKTADEGAFTPTNGKDYEILIDSKGFLVIEHYGVNKLVICPLKQDSLKKLIQ